MVNQHNGCESNMKTACQTVSYIFLKSVKPKQIFRYKKRFCKMVNQSMYVTLNEYGYSSSNDDLKFVTKNNENDLVAVIGLY